jgi:hypothetical protein
MVARTDGQSNGTRREEKPMTDSQLKRSHPDGDYIYLVNPPKQWRKPPSFDLTARGLESPRIIPLNAILDPKEYNDVEGKVRRRDLLKLVLTVPTVRLRYKKREWQEHTQFHLLIPMKLAQKLGVKMVRLSRPRPGRKK